MTRNPHGARFAVVSADGVRTRLRSFAWARAPHLPGMEAHAHIEVEPAFPTQAEVAVLLGVPERTLEGWRLTKQKGIRLVVVRKSEFTTKADRIVRDHECDIAVIRADGEPA